MLKVLACDVVARFLDTAMYIQRGNDVTVISDNGRVTTAALDKGLKTDRVNFKQVKIKVFLRLCHASFVYVSFVEKEKLCRFLLRMF